MKPKIAPETFRCFLVTVFTYDPVHVQVRILAILDLGTLFTKPKIAPKTFKCSLVTVFTCDAAHVQVRILAFLDFSTTETRHYIILKGWSLTWNQGGSRSDGVEAPEF